MTVLTGFPAPSLRSVPGMTARYDSNFGNADLACHCETRRALAHARRLRLGEASSNVGCGTGAAEAVSLHGVNACRAQKELLLGGFDAFSGDLHAEPAAEAHHRMHDGCCVRGALDAAHE